MATSSIPLASTPDAERIASIQAWYAKVQSFYSLDEGMIREGFEHVPWLLQTLSRAQANEKRLRVALEKMDEWFENLKKEQREQTMHGLKEASENWQTEWEADKSFDMNIIKAALADDTTSPRFP